MRAAIRPVGPMPAPEELEEQIAQTADALRSAIPPHVHPAAIGVALGETLAYFAANHLTMTDFERQTLITQIADGAREMLPMVIAERDAAMKPEGEQ